MKKYYLLLAAGTLGCALASLPVLASDAPTDEGNYIWQDENGDFWWRNGSEDEYLGDGNYAPDPDSGELMEANDAGWTRTINFSFANLCHSSGYDITLSNKKRRLRYAPPSPQRSNFSIR